MIKDIIAFLRRNAKPSILLVIIVIGIIVTALSFDTVKFNLKSEKVKIDFTAEKSE